MKKKRITIDIVHTGEEKRHGDDSVCLFHCVSMPECALRRRAFSFGDGWNMDITRCEFYKDDRDK